MTGPVVAIHQPQYLPTLRYFAKAAGCDLFVHLDTVQFQKGGYQNRNMVKTAQGARYLTVPVRTTLQTAIGEVAIADAHWIGKHTATLSQEYGKAPYYPWLHDEFLPLLRSGFAKLADLNIATTDWCFRRLGLTCRQVRASELDVSGSKSDLIVAICQALGAGAYYSGAGGRAYLDAARFAAAGVDLRYQNFVHPTYQQLHQDQGFLPDMAALDLIANAGPHAHDILRTATP